MIVEIDARLVEWASWARSGVKSGYPSASPLYTAVHGRSGGETLSHPAAEAIERAVLLLPDVHNRVIKHIYLGNKSVVMAANAMRMSKSTIKSRLSEAHLAIDVALKLKA